MLKSKDIDFDPAARDGLPYITTRKSSFLRLTCHDASG